MNLSTSIDKENNLRVHTLVGSVSKHELFSKLIEVYASPVFNPNMNTLWDVRFADLKSVVMSDVVEAVDFVEKQWKAGQPIRVAFLVASEMDYTLATMYETLLQGNVKLNNKIFRSIDEAMFWLKN